MSSLFRSKPSHTLILLTDESVARIDFRNRRQPIVSRRESCPRRSGLPLLEAARQAIELSNEPPGKLVVLATDFWTECLLLPFDVLNIVTPQECSDALALNAEAESGVSAFDSLVGHQRLDGDLHGQAAFCVTQIANGQLSALNELATKLKTRLAWLAHPIALDIAGGLRDPKLLAESLSQGAKFKLNSHSLDRLDLDLVCERIAKVLSMPTSGNPLCIGGRQASGKINPSIVSAALTVASILGCYAWHHYAQTNLDRIAASIDQLETQQRQHEDTLAQIKSANGKLVGLRKDAAAAERRKAAALTRWQQSALMQERHNTRWLALINELGAAPPDCWVRSIHSDVGQTIIQGISLSTAQAHEFAVCLERKIQRYGWIVAPAVTQQVGHGLYEFSIMLTADDNSYANSPVDNPVAMHRSTKASDPNAIAAWESGS